VLHVAETLIGGPASYLNAILVDQTVHLGHDNLRVIGPNDHLDHVAERELCIGFTRTGRNPDSLRRLQTCIEQAITEFRPDIVHAHSFFAGLVVRAMVDRRLLQDVSVVYCPHGWVFCRRGAPLLGAATRLVEWALQGRADQIVCISQYDFHAGARAGISSDKMFCLPNRIPDTPLRGPQSELGTFSPRARLRVAFLGRLDTQKGFDILLSAARLLRPGVEVAVAGTAAVDRSAPIQAPSNVRMLGWRSQKAADALVREADVIVVPSRWEGFGLTALEAMRAGKALVASRVDALPELVDDGFTGVLVRPSDPAALAAALNAFTPEKARTMGAAGRRKFEAFFAFAPYGQALRWRYAALARKTASTAGQDRA
jgi:glycosyltransferase involved in cell wall biosynthesis